MSTNVNFLIGGTEPAGTNQLAFLLARHPDVCMPVDLQPEPNFFSKDVEHAKGADYYHRRYFAHHRVETCVGEKSGRYLWHPSAAKRIHNYNPHMRLIFMLRTPADRAFSNYRFNCLNGIEPLDFEHALDAEERRCSTMRVDARWKDIQPFAYFDKGRYATQLRRYADLFPAERIHVLSNEQLRDDPSREIHRLLDFLDLEHQSCRLVDDAPRYASYHVRSRSMQRLIRRLNRPLLERAIMAKRSGQTPTLSQRLVQMNFVEKRTSPDPEVANRLNQRYADELATLRTISGINLTARRQ